MVAGMTGLDGCARVSQKQALYDVYGLSWGIGL